MNNVYDFLLQMSNNEELLIEYNMFFKELSELCFFVIDDYNELKELHSVFKNIITIDNEASIFCCTYGIDKSSDKLCIYSDNIWISTVISKEELQKIFSQYDTINNSLRGIVPSDIAILSQEDIIGGNIKYVIYNNGDVQMYREEMMKNEFVSLYWD